MMAMISSTTYRPQATGVGMPQRKAPLSVVPAFGCQAHAQPKTEKAKAQPKIDEIPSAKKLGAVQKWCLEAIQWYQKRTRWVGEDGQTRGMFPCAYCPSCSKYTFNAIAEFGVVKGIMMGAYRIFFKCNPVTIAGKLIYERITTGKWNERLTQPQPPIKNWSDFWNQRYRLSGIFNEPLPKKAA